MIPFLSGKSNCTKELKSPAAAMKSLAVLGCILFVLAGEAGAQPFTPISPLGQSRNGWSVYSASASFGYSRFARPFPTVGLEPLEYDYDNTATASFRYNHVGPKGTVSLLYTPSYVHRVQFEGLKAFNQSLNLAASRQLSRRWDISVSAVGTDGVLDQLLFTPVNLSATTGPVASLDDLIQAVRIGQYTSAQLASILSGTPYLGAPSRSPIYGSSYLSADLRSTVTYKSSPRLNVAFTAGASWSQNSSSERDSTVKSLFFCSTNEQAGAAVTYSLTPRSQVRGQVSSSRIGSPFGRYYLTNTNLYLNHKLTPHWFGCLTGTVKDAGSLL